MQTALLGNGIPFGLGRKWLKATRDGEFTLAEAAPNNIVSLGVGTPAQGESSVAAAQLRGVLMDTNDEVYFWIHLAELYQADLSEDIKSYLVFETGGNIAATDWRLDAKGFAVGVAPGDPGSAPDAALNFPNITLTGAQIAVTATMGWNKAGTFANDELLGIKVTLAAHGSGADQNRLLGVMLLYTISLGDPSGVRQIS